jgi:hypothetical protein
MNLKGLLTLLLFVLANVMQAQNEEDDYYSTSGIRYEDYAYRKNIHTVLLSPDPEVPTYAFLRLNTTDKLWLQFDDLDGDFKNYNYSIVHCTWDWKPSNVLLSEYLDGFATYPITSYSFSRTTLQKFTHYKIQIPDDNAKFLFSGNYLLKVFVDGDEEHPVLTKRFMVYDERVNITGSVHAATIVQDRNFKQEVDFNISYATGVIVNPFQEIRPVVMQNGRWDNAKIGLQPQFLKDNELVYDYDDINVFPGGKEYRWLDTRSMIYQGERVASVAKENGLFHVYLMPDEKRGFKRYMNNPDINGRYVVKTYQGTDSEIDADYVWVHFFLSYDMPVEGGNMYVFGSFSNWNYQPRCKMKYNAEKRGYEVSVFLKQGFYNYEYIFLKDNEKAGDTFYTEGMHQETENEYMILVYYRRQGGFIDELIGYKMLNSRQQ